MWLPKTEADIIGAVTSGALQESAIFDAKEQISKNSEIAKDIAAMANDGGVIIYGIGEDENGQITRLTPLSLDGQAEKINAIVRSSITESPVIHISTIPTGENPALGYIVVQIPPSERAPHMVVVKGEHRFYGRTATGNTPLSEGEVARLYARRHHNEVDREALLAAEINRWESQPNSKFGYLYLFARPVFIKDRLLEPLIKGGSSYSEIFNSFIDAVSQSTVYPLSTIYPDFCKPLRWIQHADGLKGPLCRPSDPNSLEAPGDILNLDVDLNGMVHLFCGRVAERVENQFLFFPEAPSGLVIRFLSFLGMLYEKAGYFGMVDLGLAISGIRGCIPHMPNNFRFNRIAVPYPIDTYRKTSRVSVLVFKEGAIQLAKEMIMPLVSAVTLNYSDPFKKLAQKS